MFAYPQRGFLPLHERGIPLNPDWCLRGGGKHVFTRTSVFNICIGRFYVSPFRGCTLRQSFRDLESMTGAIAHFRHPNLFMHVAPESLPGLITLCKAVLTEEKLRSLCRDAQQISDRAGEKTLLSYIPATSYDLLVLLPVY